MLLKLSFLLLLALHLELLVVINSGFLLGPLLLLLYLNLLYQHIEGVVHSFHLAPQLGVFCVENTEFLKFLHCLVGLQVSSLDEGI